jgi:hypothetical protein
MSVKRDTSPRERDAAFALPNCTLAEQDGVWTLFYEGKGYLRLVEAESRSDAQQQVAEMLLQSMEARLRRHS